mmetsp:Transcript_6601/g.7578  ORF Transcript_6601/g.7578 Transcript_6601/m.7578 type:complete len:710 (+) Transcript_6601:172-2301(+)
MISHSPTTAKNSHAQSSCLQPGFHVLCSPNEKVSCFNQTKHTKSNLSTNNYDKPICTLKHLNRKNSFFASDIGDISSPQNNMPEASYNKECVFKDKEVKNNKSPTVDLEHAMILANFPSIHERRKFGDLLSKNTAARTVPPFISSKEFAFAEKWFTHANEDSLTPTEGCSKSFSHDQRRTVTFEEDRGTQLIGHGIENFTLDQRRAVTFEEDYGSKDMEEYHEYGQRRENESHRLRIMSDNSLKRKYYPRDSKIKNLTSFEMEENRMEQSCNFSSVNFSPLRPIHGRYGHARRSIFRRPAKKDDEETRLRENSHKFSSSLKKDSSRSVRNSVSFDLSYASSSFEQSVSLSPIKRSRSDFSEKHRRPYSSLMCRSSRSKSSPCYAPSYIDDEQFSEPCSRDHSRKDFYVYDHQREGPLIHCMSSSSSHLYDDRQLLQRPVTSLYPEKCVHSSFGELHHFSPSSPVRLPTESISRAVYISPDKPEDIQVPRSRSSENSKFTRSFAIVDDGEFKFNARSEFGPNQDQFYERDYMNCNDRREKDKLSNQRRYYDNEVHDNSHLLSSENSPNRMTDLGSLCSEGGFGKPGRQSTREPITLPQKFVWKNYPELEGFLIDNRDEYLHHSALNYTKEQKQYNNQLTARLIKLASKCGYAFDIEVFSFVAIRDRIRCYYKSYVQSLKKKSSNGATTKSNVKVVNEITRPVSPHNERAA